MQLDYSDIDNAIWQLSNALRKQADAACLMTDLDAVHHLVTESRKVQNIGRTLRQRFGNI